MIALYDTEQVEKRIKEVLPLIIDEFTKLYGEKYRTVIEERIASANFVLYNNPRSTKSAVREALKDETLNEQEKQKLESIFANADMELEQRQKINIEVTNLFLAEIAKRYPEKIKNAKDMKRGYKTEGSLYCFGIETAGSIMAFSEDSIQELHANKTSQFRKRMIREDQITYLRKKGIDINDSNYEEIIETEECRQVIPTNDEINQIEELRKEYLDKYYQRVVEEVPTYTSVGMKYSENDNISYKDIVNNVDNSLNCNYCDVKDGKIVNTLILSVLGMLDGYRDVTLIHELVHAIELNIGTDGIARCGVQAFEANQHTALNETKTQIIAMRTAESLHEKGIYFFESPECTKVKGGTSYEKEAMFVEDFMAKFEKEILEVAMNGDMEGFLNEVGKKNFEKFSSAIDEHSNISTFQMISAMESQDPNHPITRKRKQIYRTCQDVIGEMEHEAFGTLVGMER